MVNHAGKLYYNLLEKYLKTYLKSWKTGSHFVIRVIIYAKMLKNNNESRATLIKRVFSVDDICIRRQNVISKKILPRNYSMM